LQNAESTSQNIDEMLSLSTNKHSDGKGDHLLRSVRSVKQEPTYGGECLNSVTKSVETASTHLTSSGIMSHSVTDTNVGDVKQEPPGIGGCNKSLTHGVDPTDRTVSPCQSLPVTSTASNTVTSVHPSVIDGIPATVKSLLPTIIPHSVHVSQAPGSGTSLAVISTNTVTSVQPLVTATYTSTQNQLVQGPKSVIPVIIPKVTVKAKNHVVIESLLPLTPGEAQTIRLDTSANKTLPHSENVKREISFHVESPEIQQSPSSQNSRLPSPPPVGMNPRSARMDAQSSSSVHSTIPVAANIKSNVSQGGSEASLLMMVPDCELVDAKLMGQFYNRHLPTQSIVRVLYHHNTMNGGNLCQTHLS
jgi:hypothetical protein